MEQERLRQFLQERCALESIYVEQYLQFFSDQHITEAEIPDLSHELLKEIGITAVGHRMRILKFSKLYATTPPTPISTNNTPKSLTTSPFTLDSPPIQETNIVPYIPSPPKFDILPSPPKKKLEVKNEVSFWTCDIESDSESSGDEESPINQLRNAVCDDFESRVLMNPLISTRSTTTKPHIFNIDPLDPELKVKLQKYLKRMFSICHVPPRSHQLDALKHIMMDLLQRDEKVSPSSKPINYLLQHSIGSGKSLIIAALVYLLSTVQKKKKRLFDIVLVMNDRKQLDMQLWITVSRFLSTHGIFVDSGCRPSTSNELKELLFSKSSIISDEPYILFSTLQKFIKIGSLDNTDKENLSKFKNRIAIIADEAHRSHGKRGTRLLHDFMTGETRQSMNITYFSFTSTPTSTALELFGTIRNGVQEPFHTYSISDAIKDGHIFNPIQNYLTIATNASIEVSDDISDKPHLTNMTKAVQHVTRAAASNPQLLKARAQFIVNHFVSNILHKKEKRNFKPKAMVVASSRVGILRYKDAIEEIILSLPEADRFEVVVSFTPFQIGDTLFTEEDSNGKYGLDYLCEFQKIESSVKMIIVHSKLLIGFDEPLLHTMYVDRILRGTSMVQALGRICRTAPGKRDTCVVDFVNPRKKVADVFGLYWSKTTLSSFRNFDGDKAKFKRVESQLRSYDCLEKKLKPEEAFKFLKRETLLNPRTMDNVLKLISKYISLCNVLQSESKNLNLKYLRTLKQLILQNNSPHPKKFIEKCDEKMIILVNDVKEIENGTITPARTRSLKPKSVRSSRSNRDKNDLVTVSDVLKQVGEKFKQSQDDLTPSIPISFEKSVASGMTKETLEFATGLLRRSHEIQSSDDSINLTQDITLPDQNIVKNTKIIDSSSDEEGCIDLTEHLEKKSRESKIKLQSSIKLVPRVVEITKSFTTLLSDNLEEKKEALDTLKKYVQLNDNKVELQSMDLIPKVLNAIKNLYLEGKTEEIFNTTIEILTSFCDCDRDVQLMMECGILQQLSRLLMKCRMTLAVVICKLIDKLIRIGGDPISSSISTTDLIPSIDVHIKHPNSSIPAIEQFIHTYSRLGNNPLCLQLMQKCNAIRTLTEVMLVEGASTSVLATSTLQQFAQKNHSVRTSMRNDNALRDELNYVIRDCSNEKRESLLKFSRYIWGNNNKSRRPSRGGGTTLKRRTNPNLKDEPPHKRHAPPPHIKSHHSISYHNRSR